KPVDLIDAFNSLLQSNKQLELTDAVNTNVDWKQKVIKSVKATYHGSKDVKSGSHFILLFIPKSGPVQLLDPKNIVRASENGNIIATEDIEKNIKINEQMLKPLVNYLRREFLHNSNVTMSNEMLEVTFAAPKGVGNIQYGVTACGWIAVFLYCYYLQTGKWLPEKGEDVSFTFNDGTTFKGIYNNNLDDLAFDYCEKLLRKVRNYGDVTNARKLMGPVKLGEAQENASWNGEFLNLCHEELQNSITILKLGGDQSPPLYLKLDNNFKLVLLPAAEENGQVRAVLIREEKAIKVPEVLVNSFEGIYDIKYIGCVTRAELQPVNYKPPSTDYSYLKKGGFFGSLSGFSEKDLEELQAEVINHFTSGKDLSRPPKPGDIA
ncbi:MAG: hypothetical protein AAGG80_00180, partial [Pseudomonadota bacterium]